jgi:hypothetical protein
MARKALCIGINDYPGTGNDLAGCVNDAHDWASVLESRGFAVRAMLDRDATKANIVAALQRLIGEASAGDSIVVTYSGHGTFVPDEAGDEPDARDEALCPYDIDQGNVLLDDEIHALFSRRAANVRIVLISDSCHSGSVIRWAPPDRSSGAPLPRFLPPATWMRESALPRDAQGRVLTRMPAGSKAVAFAAGGDLLMAGCMDSEFSYDARFAGRANGAFTYYALKTLPALAQNATYADWYAAIRRYLPGASYPQTPQLVGGKRNRKFKVLE